MCSYVDLLTECGLRVTAQIDAVFEANQSTELRKTCIDDKNIPAIPTPPHRAFDPGWLQFTVLCHQFAIGRKPGLGIVKRPTISLIHANTGPDACFMSSLGDRGGLSARKLKGVVK